MLNYNTGEPNARFWVLKLVKDNFGPGDKLVETSDRSHDVAVQGFVTAKGKKQLAINKRGAAQEITLPQGMAAVSISYVAPSTGDHPVATRPLQGNKVTLEPYEVAVVSVQ
jgi:hypothetical protein